MCIILDANCVSSYLDKDNTDMKPVKKWVDTKGKIVFSAEEQIKKELEHHTEMFNLLDAYRKIGKVKMLNKEKVEYTVKELKNTKGLKSNDKHILALAKVGRIPLIVTRDKNLQHDFKTIIKGKIYSKAKHKHLLEDVKCS